MRKQYAIRGRRGHCLIGCCSCNYQHDSGYDHLHHNDYHNDYHHYDLAENC